MPSYYLLFHVLANAQDSYAPEGVNKPLAVDDNCLPGWKFNPHTSKCILLVNEKKNFQDSRAACKALAKGNDGDLASSPSREANDFLKTEFTVPLWTRLGAVKIDGLWRWLDGSPWFFKTWGPGEPNGAGTGDNIFMDNNERRGIGKWNDDAQSFQSPFFCQSSKKELWVYR